jgi:spore germination protein YaaH
MLDLVPSGKILLGVPFYGVDFQFDNIPTGMMLTEFPAVDKSSEHWNVFPSGIQSLLENGYYISGTKKIEVGYWIEKGVWSDEDEVTRYSFVDKNGNLNLIYIDDERSLRLKGGLVAYERLGGTAVWRMEFGQDSMWNALNDGMTTP